MAGNRNYALDVFRGIVILNMMFVDAPPDLQSIYKIFVHTPWEGITVADLAFPGFVFAMGASLAFGGKLQETKRRWGKIFKRVAVLFLLGLLVNAFPALSRFILEPSFDFNALINEVVAHGRLFGILQRLALVYLAAYVVIRIFKGKYLIMAALLLLAVYSGLTHLYSPSAPFSRTDNLNLFIDLAIAGKDHLMTAYDAPYEPEGLFGVVSSTASMLLGVCAGRFLQRENYRMLILLGTAAFFIGGVWSEFDIISKPLWSAPYALMTAGFHAFLLFLAAILTKKIAVIKKCFKFFAAFGRNPMLFFLVTNAALVFLQTMTVTEDVSAYAYIYYETVRGFVSEAFSSSLFAALWCIMWYPLAAWLYKKNIIFKV
ncbi:MAG: DUF1624 domain-containing protein [Selenomonadaceae bacterium]|nr:DUF1624 domain-containing protein [Selenomonadaceae bacterium]